MKEAQRRKIRRFPQEVLLAGNKWGLLFYETLDSLIHSGDVANGTRVGIYKLVEVKTLSSPPSKPVLK